MINVDLPWNPAVVEQIREGLNGCVERGEDGKVELRMTLQSEAHLQRLASSLAKLMVPSQSESE